MAVKLVDVSPKNRSPHMNQNRVADIDLFFAHFDHGDSESFDGKGGMVAHSSYPPTGLVHFDASEQWKLDYKGNGNSNNFTGRDFLVDLGHVALHEIGHAFGLRHSQHPRSMMNPFYRELVLTDDGEPQLSKDDKVAIRELFGDVNCNLSGPGSTTIE